MQVSNKGSSLLHSKYALLRWFEGTGSEPREEYVEVMDDRACQKTIRGSVELSQETEVTLIGIDYTAEATVRACQNEDSLFLVTLALKAPARDSSSSHDAGALSVDDFITEEQEAAILAEIAEETLVQQVLSGAIPDELDGPSPWQTLYPRSADGQSLRH